MFCHISFTHTLFTHHIHLHQVKNVYNETVTSFFIHMVDKAIQEVWVWFYETSDSIMTYLFGFSLVVMNTHLKSFWLPVLISWTSSFSPSTTPQGGSTHKMPGKGQHHACNLLVGISHMLTSTVYMKPPSVF